MTKLRMRYILYVNAHGMQLSFSKFQGINQIEEPRVPIHPIYNTLYDIIIIIIIYIYPLT